jgi:hypothetical protein
MPETPRTFKTDRSLRAHHNKYHKEDGSLLFLTVPQAHTETLATEGTSADLVKANPLLDHASSACWTPSGMCMEPPEEQVLGQMAENPVNTVLAIPGPPEDVAQVHEFGCARSGSGDHDFAAALPVRRQEMVMLGHDLDDSGTCALDRANPVRRNPLMQRTVADFKQCRRTDASASLMT